MARLLTQAQYARKARYSRARITQLVKQGIIILKKGKVDPAQANAAIEANIDRSRRLKSETKLKDTNNRQLELIPGTLNTDRQTAQETNGFNIHHQTGIFSLTETRRQHEGWKMELTKLKLEIERGNLVPKDQANEWLSLLVTNAKIRLWGLPKRLAGELAVISDPRQIEYKLRQEFRQILEELGTPLKYGEKKAGKTNATPISHS